MKLDRRETLKVMLAGTGMAGLSSALFAQSMDPVYAAYEAASQNDPWTLITRDAPAEGFDGEAVRLHGRIPDGLRGTLFRNGPGRFSRQEYRYRHWFDGDGFIQSWNITDGGIRHRGRFVQTDKWRNEEAAGRFLVPALGSVPPNPGGLTGPDDMNVANTSVMPISTVAHAEFFRELLGRINIALGHPDQFCLNTTCWSSVASNISAFLVSLKGSSPFYTVVQCGIFAVFVGHSCHRPHLWTIIPTCVTRRTVLSFNESVVPVYIRKHAEVEPEF